MRCMSNRCGFCLYSFSLHLVSLFLYSSCAWATLARMAGRSSIVRWDFVWLRMSDALTNGILVSGFTSRRAGLCRQSFLFETRVRQVSRDSSVEPLD